MKSYRAWAGIVFGLMLAFNTPAAVLYVDGNNTNSTPPYADWSTAATNIQTAVDAATNGDLILVTNGVYRTGGKIVYGSLSNRVAVTRPMTIQSVNGAAVTTILGYQSPGTTNGDRAVRGVYLADGAVFKWLHHFQWGDESGWRPVAGKQRRRGLVCILECSGVGLRFNRQFRCLVGWSGFWRRLDELPINQERRPLCRAHHAHEL